MGLNNALCMLHPDRLPWFSTETNKERQPCEMTNQIQSQNNSPFHNDNHTVRVLKTTD